MIVLKKTKRFLFLIGINIDQIRMSIKGSIPFMKDYKEFKRQRMNNSKKTLLNHGLKGTRSYSKNMVLNLRKAVNELHLNSVS